MTYRVGPWGITIVRCIPADCPDEPVAVVVNGDQALAERICQLLNVDEQPDGPSCQRCGGELEWGNPSDNQPWQPGWRHIDRDAPRVWPHHVKVADEEAPETGLDPTQTAEQPSVVGRDANGPSETAKTITWLCTRCNHQMNGNPLLCPHRYTVYLPHVQPNDESESA